MVVGLARRRSAGGVIPQSSFLALRVQEEGGAQRRKETSENWALWYHA